MSKPGNRPASNDFASVTVDPTNLGTTAAGMLRRYLPGRGITGIRITVGEVVRPADRHHRRHCQIEGAQGV
jgi:hypothetical protein